MIIIYDPVFSYCEFILFHLVSFQFSNWVTSENRTLANCFRKKNMQTSTQLILFYLELEGEIRLLPTNTYGSTTDIELGLPVPKEHENIGSSNT